MNKNYLALLSGTVFGFGLALSQMLNPAKVLAFLDFAGDWDPSLAFVMVGAVLVMALTWQWSDRQRVVPEQRSSVGSASVDGRLVGGSIIFGIGWGLVGFCPGPAISALGLLSYEPVIFITAMVVGMAALQLVNTVRSQTRHDSC